MATLQKRVSRTTVKKEASVEDSEMLDPQALDDALERAENLLEQKKEKVMKSPRKKVSIITPSPYFYFHHARIPPNQVLFRNITPMMRMTTRSPVKMNPTTQK